VLAPAQVTLNMLLIAFGVLVCAFGELNLVVKGLITQLAALAFEVRPTLLQTILRLPGPGASTQLEAISSELWVCRCQLGSIALRTAALHCTRARIYVCAALALEVAFEQMCSGQEACAGRLDLHARHAAHIQPVSHFPQADAAQRLS